ncbi:MULTISPECIES: hypothetical protein [unclassified Algibacter]|uniref:hypothetical protein n=1 Tax=unclassified Algibacter TaxID=2615009 RepID=UPI00131E4CD1|nr:MULTISPECIES: hypothetical protein [unclassified Algibacter]MCL5129978.1 hypothetical protein [Algibacter sp. L4_22]
MNLINRITKSIPYLYFIAIAAYWFTTINRTEGLTAYPILLFAIPFLWQIIKPNKKLNFTLGITFVCLSSYLIIAYLSKIIDFSSLTINSNSVMVSAGLFVLTNFIMAMWIIKNSLRSSF